MLVLLVVVSAGVWWASRLATPFRVGGGSSTVALNASFVGSTACASCHEPVYRAWKESQHARAMQHATAKTVLGNFAQTTFRYAGVESTFFQRDGKYFVRTDGADGKLADFEIQYTFGVAPLQQYLIPFPDGRLQALSIAWDSRPQAQGGQRWFHLYPKEKINHRDELHWTQRSQNWNFMCADCHSTEVRKNYDVATGTFHTTWKEIAVGCEACHGPGSAHVEWAREKSSDTTKGLSVSLSERAGARWSIDAKTGNAVRSRARAHDTEIDLCAQCHARRSQIAEGYRAGLPFQDFYRPALLAPGLYHADGQQRDEVYSWGSFRQSRMAYAGVTCSDCHEPHGQKLRAPGNALCSNCHMAAKYDTQAHHHHSGNGAGTQCVDCHMPATTYMVVDPRRDHSLRIPRPDLTVSTGSPNACNGCHKKNDAQWAAGVIERWVGHKPKSFQRYAEAFAAAERGTAQAGPSLANVASDNTQPAIARASALDVLAQYLSRASVEAARTGLTDSDPLVRRASIAMLATMPAAQRLPLLAPLLDDPIRTVRMEAVYTLADAIGTASPAQRTAFDRAAAEYEVSQRYNADRPESRAALGNFFARQGRLDDAMTQLHSALKLDPAFIPAYVNLADLLRAQGRDAEAEQALRDGLRQVPDAAVLHHALGLTLIRLDRNAEALAELQRATQRAPADARFAYVYAVGLHSAGKTRAALAEIDRALLRHPDNRDLLVIAATIRQENGDLVGARRYARRLFQRYPDDPNAAMLARQLGALR
jgi:predicted CXXCH cytochrome family protein